MNMPGGGIEPVVILRRIQHVLVESRLRRQRQCIGDIVIRVQLERIVLRPIFRIQQRIDDAQILRLVHACIRIDAARNDSQP